MPLGEDLVRLADKKKDKETHTTANHRNKCTLGSLSLTLGVVNPEPPAG